MRARLAVLLLVLACSGCVGLPNSGPVVDAGVTNGQDERRASDLDAQPPVEDAPPLEIVNGFLEAMTAWPIQTSVAKQFLTKDAAREWNPDAATIVYSDFLPAQEVGSWVRVQLSGANRLDGSGGWRGELPAGERTVRYQIAYEDGEYRISNPADALMVPTSWFQQRFRQVSLYYFDPMGEILVPEPVFVPIGEQLATSLVAALATGPPRGLTRVVRSFLPRGLSVGLSVPVSDAGVAEIDLVGDAPPPTREEAELLFAQLAWTLRQDPGIEAFRVTIGGDEVTTPGGSTPYDVSSATRFDPAGADATALLYGVRRGVLMRGGFGTLDVATGPLGQRNGGLRSVAVVPDESRAAGVTADGRSVIVGPVQDDGPVRTAHAGATDLARPTWDAAGRLWLLDRTTRGARVTSIVGDRRRQVAVPGISGTRARQLLVSRDGTRLLAVVRTRRGDQVVTARVVLGESGGVLRAVEPTVIRPADPGSRVIDLTWSSPVAVTVLSPARAGGLSELETIPANGGFLGATQPSTIVPGKVLGVAGGPRDDLRLFAVLGDELVDVRSQDAEGFNGRIRGIDYAG